MDDIGSEIGQKMRSAVKAKLIEMGNGDKVQVDDELPDYIMIMIANKRTKEQMVDDLNLFLEPNTEVFVNWLHEVLEKLQAVTVPSAPPATKGSKHKEKKKKDKKKDEEPSKVLPSITEVIKETYIKRAKEELQVEVQVKTKPEESEPATPPPENNDEETPKDENAEDAEKQKQEKQEKDLQQLKEIQEKIYLAKKQLKNMVSDESEDDFEDIVAKNTGNVEETGESVPKTIHVNPKFLNRIEIMPPTTQNQTCEKDQVEDSNKRVVKLSEIRRAEREIYVPAFRRTEIEKNHRSTTQNSRDRGEMRGEREKYPNRYQDGQRSQFRSRYNRDRRYDSRMNDNYSRDSYDRRNSINQRFNRDRGRFPRYSSRRSRSRTRSSSRDKKTRNNKEEIANDTNKGSIKRVGSQVIVIPPKPTITEDVIDVPVNSVIKIKPRTHVSENKQASKMILLKAVTEAQKSTTAVLNTDRPKKRSIKERLMLQVSNDEIDLHYDDLALDTDEYVPEPILKTSESENESYLYIPKKKAATGKTMEEEYEPKNDATKFFATLESKKRDSRTHKSSSSVQKRPVKDRIGYRNKIDEAEEAKRRRKERFEQGYERVPIEQDEEFDEDLIPPPVIKRINRDTKKNILNSPHEKIAQSKSPQKSHVPVHNSNNETKSGNFWNDNVLESKTKPLRHRYRARTISPINFDLTPEERRSRSSLSDNEDLLKETQ